jgi:hypothetical protein
LQDDLNISLDDFRIKFTDMPQKNDLTLLCPLMDDPTEKVGALGSSSSATAVQHHSCKQCHLPGACWLCRECCSTMMTKHEISAVLTALVQELAVLQQVKASAVAAPHTMIAAVARCTANVLHLHHAVQIFVFFPDAAKVGVKEIKVRMGSSCHVTCCSQPAGVHMCQSKHGAGRHSSDRMLCTFMR